MRSYAWLLLATLALAGCNIATWGNLLAVAMTIAIFCGTLSLGRRAPPDHGTGPDRGAVEG